jgi:Lactonase, 7-bladed beta-propeller
MSIRSRISRVLLVAVLSCGLALAAGAAGAAAEQAPLSIGLLATPDPVFEGSQVKLIATLGGEQGPGSGEIDFFAAVSAAYLGSVPVFLDSGPVSITVPVSQISAVSGQASFIAVFRDGNGGGVLSAPTTLTILPAPANPPSLYVADYGSNAISMFGTGASGRPLLGTIAGPATQLSNPEGVVLDSDGDLYVANSSASTITEYGADATGNAAPIATIGGSATGLDNPRFIALDSSSDLWVVNALSNSVTEYAPNASGNVAPIATIAGSATGISNPIGIAVDRTGRVYVSNAGDNSISAYAPGSNGNVAPVYLVQGSQTGLDGPKGLAFNAAGALMVANDVGGVTYYSTGWQGNRPPGEVLAGPATGLINSEQPIIDPSNNTLLVDSLTQGTLNSWPAEAGGNIAPSASIQIGAGTEPTQIALNPLNP